MEITEGIGFVRRMEAPTLLGTWGALAFVLIANTAVVLWFRHSVCIRMELEEKDKKDEIKSNGAVKDDLSNKAGDGGGEGSTHQKPHNNGAILKRNRIADHHSNN